MKGNQGCGPAPEYDLDATRERFVASGRKFRPWAVLKQLNPDTFGRMMSGTQVPKRGGKVERKILAALAEDGLLALKKKSRKKKRAQASAA